VLTRRRPHPASVSSKVIKNRTSGIMPSRVFGRERGRSGHLWEALHPRDVA